MSKQDITIYKKIKINQIFDHDIIFVIIKPF